ncbi:hypothetical protein P3U10_04450 [Mammaliicoccus sciuri]|uniref:hypothetical protein n=1 Tax=Mammaliicoccus sciuri TaxID=1296 RepID=UPI002B25A5C8|nr:hypothetical protein [Mammaliicoccus sciuri]WQK61434.1 hypothetical protein P3U10_04450 [Mammaliicoccus sciuri]
MSSVEEQIQEIQTKDELIKWLINEYFTLSNKAYGNNFKEVIDNELKVIKSKAGTLMTSCDSTYDYEYTNKQVLHNYYNYSGDKAGIEELYEVYKKAKKYNEIYNAINAHWIEYPEDWMPEVYMIVNDYEGDSKC